VLLRCPLHKVVASGRRLVSGKVVHRFQYVYTMVYTYWNPWSTIIGFGNFAMSSQRICLMVAGFVQVPDLFNTGAVHVRPTPHSITIHTMPACPPSCTLVSSAPLITFSSFLPALKLPSQPNVSQFLHPLTCVCS